MSSQISVMGTIERETAEFHLRRLNWYFDMNPDLYLVQVPRTVYDNDGKEKHTVRYEIRERNKENTIRKGESDNGEQQTADGAAGGTDPGNDNKADD